MAAGVGGILGLLAGARAAGQTVAGAFNPASAEMAPDFQGLPQGPASTLRLALPENRLRFGDLRPAMSAEETMQLNRLAEFLSHDPRGQAVIDMILQTRGLGPR